VLLKSGGIGAKGDVGNVRESAECDCGCKEKGRD